MFLCSFFRLSNTLLGVVGSLAKDIVLRLFPQRARVIRVLTSNSKGGHGCDFGGGSGAIAECHCWGDYCTVLHFEVDMFKSLFTTPRYR